MRTRLKSLAGIALAVVLAGAAAAQSASTPTDAQLTDARLTVSTLVREDLFAGFLTGDMTALSRGEANLEKLYTARPNARGETRAWQAGAAMYRAVRAREAGNNAQYTTLYAQAQTYLGEADQFLATQPAVAAVGGGLAVLWGDRVAPADRAPLWNRAYGYFQGLTTAQAPIIANLPPHIRGESLGGLTMAAQRSGREAEAAAALEKFLPLAAGTPYEAKALKWKNDPASRASLNLGCISCHDDGRLAPTVRRQQAAAAPKTGA